MNLLITKLNHEIVEGIHGVAEYIHAVVVSIHEIKSWAYSCLLASQEGFFSPGQVGQYSLYLLTRATVLFVPIRMLCQQTRLAAREITAIIRRKVAVMLASYLASPSSEEEEVWLPPGNVWNVIIWTLVWPRNAYAAKVTSRGDPVPGGCGLDMIYCMC